MCACVFVCVCVCLCVCVCVHTRAPMCACASISTSLDLSCVRLPVCSHANDAANTARCGHPPALFRPQPYVDAPSESHMGRARPPPARLCLPAACAVGPHCCRPILLLLFFPLHDWPVTQPMPLSAQDVRCFLLLFVVFVFVHVCVCVCVRVFTHSLSHTLSRALFVCLSL